MDTNGAVMDARRVKTAGNTWLDASAMEAARQAVFTPGRTGDKKVRVWMSIPFRFQLPQPDTLRPTSPAPVRDGYSVDADNHGKLNPRLLSVPVAVYPESVRKAGIEGQAVVEVLFDTSGTVIEALILKSAGNRLLDTSAVEAARHAIFAPYLVRGKAVQRKASIPFRFVLQ